MQLDLMVDPGETAVHGENALGTALKSTGGQKVQHLLAEKAKGLKVKPLNLWSSHGERERRGLGREYTFNTSVKDPDARLAKGTISPGLMIVMRRICRLVVHRARTHGRSCT